MSDIAIRVENLSKQYRIGAQQQGRSRYKSLREELTKAVQAPFHRAGKLLRGQTTGAADLDETIWALKDVSFEVQRGEVVGIIGRNGAGTLAPARSAGETTLLKILSRITEPTEGRAEVHGHIGSLLEACPERSRGVGTGSRSDPELTGRENIYLNGAILGMKRAEIERKFDEMVAFAVAAHLEPEILLVDEVLAVGDAAFQKKCLGKMGDVAREGRR